MELQIAAKLLEQAGIIMRGGGERIKGFDGINKGVEVLEMLEQAGDVALKVPENYTVTSADVANHPVVAQPAAGLSVCVSMDFLL